MVYFAVQHLKVPHGIMITGSHNPKEDNGFKMILNGEALYGEALPSLKARMEALIERPEPLNTPPRHAPKTISILAGYLEAVVSRIQLAAPLNIVVDCGNAAAGVVAESLFTRLGCKVTSLYCELDGHFPNHHPDPGQPKNLMDLQKAVLETQADLGLAFDGDGDRLGVVDNEGQILWPDRLLMLFARDVLKRHPQTPVIFDVKCSQNLSGFIQQHHGIPVLWKTGHSLIKAKMKETGALLAGELSGHIFFKERWFGFDDGVYAAARLLEILSQARLADPKSCAADQFRTLPNSVSTPELHIAVSESEKFKIIQTLVEQKHRFGGKPTLIDGLRIDFENGFGLIRASNTGSNLILRFEGTTTQVLEDIQANFRKHLIALGPHLSF